MTTHDPSPLPSERVSCSRCSLPFHRGTRDPKYGWCVPCAIAHEAELALGEVLVRRLPDAVFGDLSPETSIHLSRTLRDAAAEWIANNAHNGDTDGDLA